MIEEPCPAALNAALAQLHAPFGRAVAPLSSIRDALHARCGRRRASCAARPVSAKRRRGLDDLDASLDATGMDGRVPAFNLARHDWLNLKSLILVSRTIVAAASARAESCGAHWREDAPRTAPETDSLASPVTTLGPDGRIDLSWQPIAFTRVQPGQSLLPAE